MEKIRRVVSRNITNVVGLVTSQASDAPSVVVASGFILPVAMSKGNSVAVLVL